MNNTSLNEDFLDDAATEAIGAHSVEESDAFTVMLGEADEAHRQATRDLRDTVARMAGVAPYIDPPSALRGRILEATAPKSFKIEDYRRNGDIAPKWLRRSLVASIGFLIFAAWYNASAKTAIDNLTAKNQKMADTMKVAEKQYNDLAESNQRLASALSGSEKAFANAVYANTSAPRGYVQDPAGKKYLLVQDPSTAQYLVMIPNQFVMPNSYVTLNRKGADGQVQEYKALLVPQPDASGFSPNMVVAERPVNAQWIGVTNEQSPPPINLRQSSLFQP